MHDHAGSRVLVTGACGGIGEAIARRFAAAGAAVALADIRGSELATLAADLTAKGAKVYHEAVDVGDDTAVAVFCASAVRELGSLNQLVNTVGSVDNMGDVAELSVAAWDRALRVNLTSAFLVAHHATRFMIDAGGGSIVNISSISGLANQARMMAYSVTKAAMLALTRSEAIDLARHGIRANAVCPGSVDTPLVDEAIRLMAAETDRSAAETRRDWESQYPTGRFTQPDEVADLTLFLCSAQASNITGASFVIDGGLTALLPER